MPTALSGIASRVAPLRIPTSVSGLKGVDSPSATPRSALVAPQLSVGSPLSVAVPSMEGTGELPSSPRSPQSPGGRRKRSPKIDGLDYYEFCELLRSSSL
ncbi:hypothetical protein H632_c1939p0 [Helicosporidium sp. ATCC 50920]|nr:hypothetical protein H632_c1939p0 [Helicosporidium sp. ATCC 50920]|eukprot:KDD73674.1 hypothetical protein H632_c1939p0 [Helicosporidium sp. ATCC 50920]